MLEVPGLRVDVAEPRYLLALKLRAAREEDADDVRLLAALAGDLGAPQALELLEQTFPVSLPGPRVRFFVEEVLGEHD